jgi:hypothetical protein
MIPGNVEELNGVPGTLFENLYFDYLYQDFPDHFVDFIGQDNGLVFFESQDSRGRAVYYGGNDNSYRAVHSAILFGGIRNGTHTKTELMNMYMDYLTETMGVRDTNVVIIDDVIDNSITLAPNPFHNSVTFSFSLIAAQHVTIDVYNITGQRVRTILDNYMNEGAHKVIWDGTDENNRRVGNGTYLMRSSIGDEILTKPVVYIR